MTGVEVTVGSNDDLVPSDNEEDSELDDQFHDVISDSDKDEDDDVIANLKTPLKKLKTPIRKRKKTPMKPVNPSKKKSTTQGKKDPESQVIELRLRNLEEVTSQIDSQLASAELVSQENLIGEIVKRKIEEELKDLKEQQKNSISLLTKKVKDLEEQFETKLTALKTDMEKIKTRISNTNERCGKMEKSLKEARNLMVIKVNELRDQLTEDLTTKNNTVFKSISLLHEIKQTILYST